MKGRRHRKNSVTLGDVLKGLSDPPAELLFLIRVYDAAIEAWGKQAVDDFLMAIVGRADPSASLSTDSANPPSPTEPKEPRQ